MNRRNFLSLLGMTVGGLALDQAIPFNRVWSFPKKIVVPQFRDMERFYRTGEVGTLYGFRFVRTSTPIKMPQRWRIVESHVELA